MVRAGASEPLSTAATRYDFMRLCKSTPGTTYRDSTVYSATREISNPLVLIEKIRMHDLILEQKWFTLFWNICS